MGFANRLAQRSGFGIIIALLAISTLMAWSIQENLSARNFEIHRRYVQEQEILTSLRRIMWAASVVVRDYYLDPSPNREELNKHLSEFTAESKLLVAGLQKLGSDQAEIDDLEAQLNQLWDWSAFATQQNWDPERRFELLQKEIVPRRDAASRILREIEKANHTALTESDVQMRDNRAGAARSLLIILGACLLSGLVVAWFSIRHGEYLEREAGRRFLEVLEAKQHLEELSARLMEVQEEERTRLSRELHDEIVQNLAVLKMEIVQAQSQVSGGSDPREPLARARRLAETTVRSVRDISLLLRPSLLDDLGLEPALQWQSEEFARRTGVPCRLEETGVSEQLPEAIKTCVYRVTQEALRNCEKHSAATLVRVRVKQTADQLEVVIEDNGKGFTDAERKPASLGLLGMRERAIALGGKLHVANRPEGGASVQLILPLTGVAKPGYSGAHA